MSALRVAAGPWGLRDARLSARRSWQHGRFDVGERRIRVRLEGDFLPRSRISQQRTQQLVVERMPRLVPAELANQAVSEQIQIADRIEDLVLHELVLVA